MKATTKHNIIAALSVITLMILAGCSGKRMSGKRADIDSTHTAKYIASISMQEPERALAIIDTIETNKEQCPYMVNYMRFAVYLNAYADYKMANYYGQQAMKDSINLQKDVDNHFSLLSNLSFIACSNSQYAQSIKYAKAAIEVARRNNLKEYEYFATEYLATSIIKLGDTDQGLKLFAEGKDYLIKALDDDLTFEKVENTYSFVANYMQNLFSIKRYDEAGKLIPDLLYVNKKYEEFEDVIEGAAEYRMLTTYGFMIYYYDKTGNSKESEKYLAKILKSELAGTSLVESLVSEHYQNIKDIKKLEEITSRIRKNTIANNDTISDYFIAYVLENELLINNECGNYREALEKAKVISSVKDSIYERNNREDAMRFSKLFETQEKERLLQVKDAQLSQHRIILIVVVVLLVIGVTFIVIVLRFNRRVNRRNKTIVATINQMMQKDDQLTRLQLTDDSSKADNIDPEEIRLKQSLEMLKDDKPIDEIVTECGYRDANDFGKKFYDHFGIHVEDYRKWSNNMKKQEKTGIEEAKQMKQSFIRNMSHEIRTPLNQIYGFVQLLTTPGIQLSDEQKQKYTGIIDEQTSHMTQMLNTFLEISQYESSNEPLPVETVNIDEVLTMASDSFLAIKDGVELSAKNNSGLETLECNQKGLLRILHCIIDNAVKFTDKGYVSVECASNADGNIVFSVTDTGKGIPEGDEERIFEQFYKVDEFIPGTGLGLSLARQIANRMGASIVLDRSYEAKGSRFVISYEKIK